MFGLTFFNKNYANLFMGQLLAHISDAIVQILIIATVMTNVEKPGSTIALMLFCFVLPSLIISPFAGSLTDKISRKKIMSLSAAYKGLVLTAALLAYTFLYKGNATPELIKVSGALISILTGVGTAFIYPAKMSTVPNIVSGKYLKPANALISGTGTWALTFGAYIITIIIPILGELNLYKAACGIYFLSALFFMGINSDNTQFSKECNAGVLEDFKKTVNFLNNHKKAYDMIILAVILSLISAMFYNAMNALATDTYNVSVQSLAVLKCKLGAGTGIGLILMFLFGKKFKTNNTLVCSFLGLFLFLFTASVCNTFNKAYFWLYGIGIFASLLKITMDTILQKASPDFIRGKIFAFASMLETFVTLIGTAFVSLLVGKFISPIGIFHITAIVCALMALIILALNKNFRYFVFRITMGQIFKYTFNYKVEGLDNIPPCGKVILAGNHTGKLDLFIVQMATKRNLWFVTGPVAFQIPVLGKMLKWFNVLPLQFGSGINAIEAAVQKLKTGEPVVIFPEGKLSTDDSISRFKRGIGIMAKEADCPIVPFAIKGGFRAWSKFKINPRFFTKIVIQFGQPIKDLSGTEKEIAKELQQRVQFMKNSLDRRSFYHIKDEHYTNFLDIMKQYSDTYGQSVALSMKTKTGYEEITYIELKRLAKTLGNYLMEKADVQRGDRIAILSESRPEFAIGMFGSIQTGAITVPLDVKLTVAEHTHILSDCNPKILLCSSHYLSHALEVKNHVNSIQNIFVLDDDEDNQGFMSVSKMTANLSYSFNRARSMDETALIVYTSGTTGNPKGVMISFGNIYSQMKDFEKIFKLSKDNTLLSILPLNHLLELNVGFFGMLFMGAKVVYIKSLNPKELTGAMKEKQVTNMIVVPLVAKMLKNSITKQINKLPKEQKKIFDLMYQVSKFLPRKLRRIMFKNIIDGLGGKLECFISGGAPLETDVAEFFERIGVPVFEGYGLTETSPVISTNEYKHHKIGTVGIPLPSVTVQLSEQKELIVKGPNVMQGYYNKPDMTKEVIDEQGWFHTGDIGEIDNDGFIKITGRIKNMIVLGGGKKIFPEEVEAVLETSNLIKEVCVLSLKIKSGNKKGTEEVGAIIVPNDELSKKEDDVIQKELEKEVKTLSEKNLAPYKMPTVVVFRREELPKTSTQKVKRKDLLTWYEEQ